MEPSAGQRPASRDSAVVSHPETASESAADQRLRPAEVDALYAQFGSDVLAFLAGVLRDRDLAAEALQNTFRRLLEVGHTARPESVKGWLFKVAFHEGLALKRRQGADHRAILQYGRLRSASQGIDSAGLTRGDSPQMQELISDEEVRRLRQGLAELPAEQRWVVERRIDHEETFAVIAANLGVPLGTVLTRMRLALQKLERILKHDDG